MLVRNIFPLFANKKRANPRFHTRDTYLYETKQTKYRAKREREREREIEGEKKKSWKEGMKYHAVVFFKISKCRYNFE